MLMTAGRADFIKDQFIDDMRVLEASLSLSLISMPVTDSLKAYVDEQTLIFHNVMSTFEVVRSENPDALDSLGILYHLVLNEYLHEFRQDSYSGATVAYDSILAVIYGSVPASVVDAHQMQACDIRLRSMLVGR